jgi:hypothetical protein
VSTIFMEEVSLGFALMRRYCFGLVHTSSILFFGRDYEYGDVQQNPKSTYKYSTLDHTYSPDPLGPSPAVIKGLELVTTHPAPAPSAMVRELHSGRERRPKHLA